MFSPASLSGDFTLDINPVSLEDDARFQCQVGAADEGRVAPIRSRYATVTVLVPPEPPVIVLRSSAGRQLIAGDEVELRCESRGGKPASEVSVRETQYGTMRSQAE